MDSFNHGLWDIVVFTLSLGGLFALLYFAWANSQSRVGGSSEPTGHVWDEDLGELNNPLPRWWLNFFYLTIVFAGIYLVLYPGLGTQSMLLGWSQIRQYEEEMAAAEAKYGPLFASYLAQDVKSLAADRVARNTGRRLFLNYCAACHGTDARGATGFPNLRDHDWLYGSTPEAIEASILDGRTGIMPPWSGVLGEAGVAQMTQHVLALSGRSRDREKAAAGKARYGELCVGCHGANGRGNPELGAPDLTDGVWLYGGDEVQIEQSIAQGRQGRMPAHRQWLGEAKIRVLAAYVWSLSHLVEAREPVDGS